MKFHFLLPVVRYPHGLPRWFHLLAMTQFIKFKLLQISALRSLFSVLRILKNPIQILFKIKNFIQIITPPLHEPRLILKV